VREGIAQKKKKTEKVGSSQMDAWENTTTRD